MPRLLGHMSVHPKWKAGQTGISTEFRKFGKRRKACDLRSRIDPRHEKDILQEVSDHFYFTLTGFL